MNDMRSRVWILILASGALAPLGCLHTDSAVVRTNRPSMATYGRTTEPNKDQVLDLVAAAHAADSGDYQDAIGAQA